MKWLINARTVGAAGFLVGAAALYVPTAAQAQTAVSANWTQISVAGPSARAGASMVYDSVRARTVLFGGNDSVNFLGDTWQYDGSAWTQLRVAGPAGRYLAPMVFDSARGVSVLTGGVGLGGIKTDTWEWNGSSWNQKLTIHSPPRRFWTAMTYDAVHHVTVLFGGVVDTGYSNDTWEYDGNDWTQVITAHSPSARRGMGMAFDAARGRTVLFGGQDPNFGDLNDTWEFDGTDWTQVATAASPTARLWHSMAYDPNLGGVVMMGGSSFGTNNSPQADTWLYDGSAWTQMSINQWGARFWAAAVYELSRSDVVLFGGSTTALAAGGQIYNDTWSLAGVTTSTPDWGQANPAASPSPRVFGQMDYDSARGLSVLFGGSSDSGPGNLHDTWEWDGARWTLRSPATSPPAVAGGTMAYDSARGVSVLFGGSGSAGTSSQTWEWDGTNWTQPVLGTAPTAAVWAAMAYDSAARRMVLFEGDPNGGLPAQTWEYDGTTWIQQHPVTSPSARRGPAMAYDPARGRTVLFGGEDATGRLADTWEWDGSKWTQIATATAPHPRFWASLNFDAQRGRTVLFGGDHIQPYDLGESNDTWEWDGVRWTRDWPAAAPPIRSGQTMDYDSARGRLVVFGGWNAATSPVTIYGDTWELGSGIRALAGTSNANVFVSGTLSFGNVNAGSTSPGDAAFTYVSVGTGPLTVYSITLSGDSAFALTSDCPTSGNPLPAGSYCVALVSFTPTTAGTRTATVSFNDNSLVGTRSIQVQGNGVVNPTSLTVSSAVSIFNGGATITASLLANGSPFAGQPVTLTLPTGGTVTTATDSSGLAIFFGVSFAGIHAGTYPTGLTATFAGSPAYAPSAASASLTITQPVTTTYTGAFYVTDATAGTVAITVDQRTPASDPAFIDYTKTAVWARFTVSGPATSADFYAQITDAPSWSTTGLGVARASLPALPDGAYTVVATLVDGNGSTTLSTATSSDDSRTGYVSSPTKGGYVSGGGAIATDPAANTGDRHGYFSVQMKQGKAPVGNLVYVYRVRMDVGGGNVRDVDVSVTSTGLTTLTGRSATGQFTVQFVDAHTGQRYSAFEFSGGTFMLTFANATDTSPPEFGLVLTRADGTVFHSTGSAPAPVVLGRLVSTL